MSRRNVAGTEAGLEALRRERRLASALSTEATMRQILLTLLLPVRRRREGVHPASEAAAEWQEFERAAARWRIYEQARAEEGERP